jgi:hypothetical protein
MNRLRAPDRDLLVVTRIELRPFVKRRDVPSFAIADRPGPPRVVTAYEARRLNPAGFVGSLTIFSPFIAMHAHRIAPNQDNPDWIGDVAWG